MTALGIPDSDVAEQAGRWVTAYSGGMGRTLARGAGQPWTVMVRWSMRPDGTAPNGLGSERTRWESGRSE